jgi:hypothetical protein
MVTRNTESWKPQIEAMAEATLVLCANSTCLAERSGWLHCRGSFLKALTFKQAAKIEECLTDASYWATRAMMNARF